MVLPGQASHGSTEWRAPWRSPTEPANGPGRPPSNAVVAASGTRDALAPHVAGFGEQLPRGTLTRQHASAENVLRIRRP